MLRLPGNPKFWLAGFLVWCAVLWLLSSFSGAGKYAPPVHHFDKVVHFGYFAGGSGLLAGWMFRRRPGRKDWGKVVAVSIAVVAVIGAVDEWHQSFTPGRSGNDPYDWAADFLGAVAGAFALQRIHRRVE